VSHIPPTRAELRDFLSRILPTYMVPSQFVTLDALPLSGQGKVDRKALPLPDAVPQTTTELPPDQLTPIEQVVLEAWNEVFQGRVGVHDNFFDLGGDSVAAMQIMSRLNNALAIELPLRSLFEHPTPSDLAEAVAMSKVAVADPEDLQNILSMLDQLSDEDAG